MNCVTLSLVLDPPSLNSPYENWDNSPTHAAVVKIRYKIANRVLGTQ